MCVTQNTSWPSPGRGGICTATATLPGDRWGEHTGRGGVGDPGRVYGGICNSCHQGVPRKCPPQPPAGPLLPPSRARLLSWGARLPGAQQDTGRGHVDLQLRALVSALGTWTRGLGAQRVTAATQPAAWTPGVAAAAGRFLVPLTPSARPQAVPGRWPGSASPCTPDATSPSSTSRKSCGRPGSTSRCARKNGNESASAKVRRRGACGGSGTAAAGGPHGSRALHTGPST